MVCIKGPPCKPGKTAEFIFLFNSSLFVKIIPPLGPLKTLCVVEVTTSANFIGLGYCPPATKPAKCAISTIRVAFTVSAISLNFLKLIILEYALPPAIINLGLFFKHNSSRPL